MGLIISRGAIKVSFKYFQNPELIMRRNSFYREGKALGHGDVTGGFNSSSLDFTMSKIRDAFLDCIRSIQTGNDPKPYLITLYGMSMIGDYAVRDKIIMDFEECMDELDEEGIGRYSPEGIKVCIAGWAAINEYLGLLGADKRITVLGESSTVDENNVDMNPYSEDNGEEDDS